jgi:hypothetical protein
MKITPPVLALALSAFIGTSAQCAEQPLSATALERDRLLTS